MLDKQTNEWNFSGRKKHLLTGLVFCKCGSRITYNLNHGKFARCVCSSYKKYGKEFCSNVHLHEDELIQRVTESLRENITKYLNMEELEYSKTNKNVDEDYKKDIQHLEKKREDIEKIISNLYEDKIAGTISLDTFTVLIKKYEEQKKEYAQKLELLEKKQKNTSHEMSIEQEEIKETARAILSFNEINDDNKSLVFKLIEKIIIDDKDIEIRYKFDVSA